MVTSVQELVCVPHHADYRLQGSRLTFPAFSMKWEKDTLHPLIRNNKSGHLCTTELSPTPLNLHLPSLLYMSFRSIWWAPPDANEVCGSSARHKADTGWLQHGRKHCVQVSRRTQPHSPHQHHGCYLYLSRLRCCQVSIGQSLCGECDGNGS